MRRMSRRSSGIFRRGRTRRSRWLPFGFSQWSELWRHRLMLASGALTAIGAITGGLIWADRADLPGQIGRAIHETAIGITVDAGFAIRQVYVAGRKEATRQEIKKALGIQIGDPILVFDPDEARERIVSLGWVADARVERRLPDTVFIAIDEREPIAIWQHERRFVLVDKEGTVIGSQGLERYRHLKILIGEDAPRHATALFAMLRENPQLMDRVTHATWVAGRRWNVRIEDAVDIRLPASDPASAWRKFTEMEREYGLLRSDMTAVDLRMPDRITVRMNQGAERVVHHDDRT